MSKDTLNVGDTVTLKSGGPFMTIESVEGGVCKCTWFDDKNQLQQATLNSNLLKRREPAEGYIK